MTDPTISLCAYSTLSSDLGLADLPEGGIQAGPVTAQAHSPAPPAVVAEAFSSVSSLLELAEDMHTGRENQARLTAFFEAITEHGRDMLPLLHKLQEMARQDERLAGLAEVIKETIRLDAPQSDLLAPREREVMERVALGESNKEIARALGLQVITVGKCLSRAYRKLGARNRGEAVTKWLTTNRQR